MEWKVLSHGVNPWTSDGNTIHRIASRCKHILNFIFYFSHLFFDLPEPRLGGAPTPCRLTRLSMRINAVT
jgi:hypothetical protein